jgi:hypothetical protein
VSLEDLLAKPSSGYEVVPGFADIYPYVRVGGLQQPALWPDTVYAAPGEPVLVGVMRRPDAPAQLVVACRLGKPGPVSAIVSAVPAGSDTVTVTEDSVDYSVNFASDLTLAQGDRVRLMWQGPVGTAVCKVGVTPAAAPPAAPTAAPPQARTTGTLPVPAVDSGTFSVGFGWNSRYGQNLHQGNASVWGGPSSNHGAWFYGANAAQLVGATVTGIRFRVPARTSAGQTSSTVTAHFYLHTSPNKPGGDVARTSGPVNFNVPPGYRGGDWIDLPAEWGATLIAGGGISISGDPYLGLVGRSDPESGLLQLTWTR